MSVVVRVSLGFAAENAVGQRTGRAVKGCRVQPLRARTERRVRPLHDHLHALRNQVGARRENQAQQGDFHIIPQQQADVADEHHAGIENLGRELAHAFRAGVHIGNRLGEHCAAPLAVELAARAVHEVGVQNVLHAAVDVVGEAAHVQALDVADALHRRNRQQVGEREQHHTVCGFRAVQHVLERTDQPPLEKRPGEQTDIVQQT